ncbi:Ppx/GppA phosphatase family protein [Swingsia samuiensis]|uniref:Ppx/GppA family phosphatase n=1 Tax=Swingsia samuiensis TaxID=1293412 RepID=A0A4Y6UN71_9PROT|nr:Ppx/GppA phosphatase family protein [Swingsia samuiensis]QDH17807.1 Ppx/GppA family phosphatase [Swingsia samuiensis]
MKQGGQQTLSSHFSTSSMAPRLAGPFFGAIDLGTNNCRLMIAAPTARGFRVVDNFNRAVRLGEGLRGSGFLAEDAMRRTLDALKICADRMTQWPLSHVQAVATEACRQAINGKEFLDRVQKEIGLTIDIITAREEAELALESCSPLFPSAQHYARAVHKRGIIFDIGGGSTEIAWVQIDHKRKTQTLIGMVSLPTGVIALQEMFGEGHDAISYKKMVSYVKSLLSEFEATHRIRDEVSKGQTCLLGTSGTVTTLAGIALRLPQYDRSLIDGITLPGSVMKEAIKTLQEIPNNLRGLHPCVGKERVKYVLPGCAIFEAIHQSWPINKITIADRGLRDGMLLRMARNYRIRSHSYRPKSHFRVGIQPHMPFESYLSV